jgi:secreted trypsin-like serine protease
MLLKTLVLISVVLLSAEGRKAVPLPGYHLPNRRAQIGPDIIGGEVADEGQFPHQIALLENLLGIKFLSCGGSIISSKYVITAAHCVVGQYPSLIYIRAGETDLLSASGNEQEFRAKTLIPHPNFSYDDFTNDIAIIEINGEFEFNEFVQPIPLPDDGEEVEDGTDCTVSGFGTTFEGGPAARRLHYVDVPYVSDEQCGESYAKENMIVAPSMLCAGVKGRDACQGDSGGPMLCNNGSLAGVVSWGLGCALEGYPGVYTQVSYFRDFIREHTGL